MIWFFPILRATVGRWEYQRLQGFIRGLVKNRIEVRFFWGIDLSGRRGRIMIG